MTKEISNLLKLYTVLQIMAKEATNPQNTREPTFEYAGAVPKKSSSSSSSSSSS